MTTRSEPSPVLARRPLNMRQRRRIDVLRRRAAWLRKATDEARARDKVLGFAEDELSAIEWAIDCLADTPETETLRAALNALAPSADAGPVRGMGTDE